MGRRDCPSSMKTLEKTIPIDKGLDGARVLFRHFLSTRAPREGWVREFSKDATHVRISRTNSPTDAGNWWRVYDLRVEAILEPGRAPAEKSDEPGFKYREDL